MRARPSGAAMTSPAPATTAIGNAHSWNTPRSRGFTLAIASAALSRAVAIASVALSRALATAPAALSRALDVASTHVIETRAADGGATVRRRRACARCGQRLTTYERVVAERLWVRKRDGERQRFDGGKLRASLLRAAHKRPLSGAELDAIAG